MKESTNNWLPAEAVQFLKDNVKYGDVLLPDHIGNLHTVSVPVRRSIGTYGPGGIWDLHVYELQDGRMAKEQLERETSTPQQVNYWISLEILPTHKEVMAQNFTWNEQMKPYE